REEPTNVELLERAIEATRRAGVEVPHDMLAATPRWAPFVAHVARWRTPLTPEEGYAERELAEAVRGHSFPVPRALLEFYRLAGKRQDLIFDDSLVRPGELARDESGFL